MKKYNLSITVQVKEEVSILYQKTFSKNVMDTCYRRALYYYLYAIMPNVSFVLDDGNDVCGSNYCQYVCYLMADEIKSCILASYNVCED